MPKHKHKHTKPVKRRFKKYRKKMQRSQKKAMRNFNLTARKITIGIIIIAVIAVLAAIIAKVVLLPELFVPRKIAELTTNYYENEYYDQFTQSADDYVALMKKYEERGLARVPLRQILLSDTNDDEFATEMIREYCDIDTSYVKYFPQDPYDATSYTVEYDYTCNF